VAGLEVSLFIQIKYRFSHDIVRINFQNIKLFHSHMNANKKISAKNVLITQLHLSCFKYLQILSLNFFLNFAGNN